MHLWLATPGLLWFASSASRTNTSSSSTTRRPTWTSATLAARTWCGGLPHTADVTLTFHTSYAGLAKRLPTLFERTSTAGMVWVCWPKLAAQKALGLTSDLDENVVRDLGLELGFVDVKVAAIDDTWSGLKFVRRLADR